MSDIQHFFKPIELDKDSFSENQIGKLVDAYTTDSYFPELKDIDMAIVGVCEDRRAYANVGCAVAPDKVRDYLYSLYPGSFRPRIVDLGNIHPGHDVEDTYYAVKSTVDYLIRNNVIPIIIGGSQDLTYAQFLGYEKLEQTINVVAIDSTFDLGNPEEDVTNTAYLGKIILHQPNFLFTYSNIG